MPGAQPRSLRPWQPWAALGLFASLLHFVWEMLQAPLYADMASAPHWAAVLECARATGGDVLITASAYAGAAVWTHDRLWLGQARRGSGLVVFLGAGLVITSILEWLNVYVWRTWAYAPDMPLVLGVGLAPILQWLLVPPLILWLARRHLGLSSSSEERRCSGREGISS